MSDLIDRQDVIETITQLPVKVDNLGYTWMIAGDVLKQIENIPSAEPERTAKVERQGICWEDIRHYKEGMCASCGRNVYDHAKYCDECGCRLEWE